MVSINTNLSSMLVVFLPLSLRRGQGEVQKLIPSLYRGRIRVEAKNLFPRPTGEGWGEGVTLHSIDRRCVW